MRLTKYSHSCVRLDDEGRTLVIDPGVFSETGEALAGVDAVLITHEHPDHVDPDAVQAAAAANPELQIWAPRAVAESLTALGDRVHASGPGESFDAAGFAVQTFGGQHAVIHPSIPVIANIGYLIDGRIYHPGDSFFVPPAPVQTLLVPLHAPWSKTAEVADFVVSVRAAQAFQIHDVLLADVGRNATENMVRNLSSAYGVEFTHLDPLQALEA